jgi:ribosomal protein L30/L7E
MRRDKRRIDDAALGALRLNRINHSTNRKIANIKPFSA